MVTTGAVGEYRVTTTCWTPGTGGHHPKGGNYWGSRGGTESPLPAGHQVQGDTTPNGVTTGAVGGTVTTTCWTPGTGGHHPTGGNYWGSRGVQSPLPAGHQVQGDTTPKGVTTGAVGGTVTTTCWTPGTGGHHPKGGNYWGSRGVQSPLPAGHQVQGDTTPKGVTTGAVGGTVTTTCWTPGTGGHHPTGGNYWGSRGVQSPLPAGHQVQGDTTPKGVTTGAVGGYSHHYLLDTRYRGTPPQRG